jgi:hypothetical protein
MNTNESWIAEQARLLDLEEGFGPTPTRTSNESQAPEDIAARPAAA